MEMSVGAIERYNKDPEMKEIWDFNQKFKVWAEVELVVMEAKEKLGRIPKGVVPEIEGKIMDQFSMNNIEQTIQEILKIEKVTHHDMKAFVEVITSNLTEKQASYVHAGVTSYDIEDPALALNMVRSIRTLINNLTWLLFALHKLAKKYKHQPQIFRTHGVHAQPGTFGLKILYWYSIVKRQIKELRHLLEEISIAKISGAVGTYTEIDPEIEELALNKLGLKRASVSTQIVPRDIHASFVSRLAIISGDIDKFATDIRDMQKTEILEVEEPFRKGQVGSSAMPHKRNPVRCESICSLARLIKGFSIVALMNQNTWHERDLANSANERFTLPYSAILLNHMIKSFTGVIERLNVYPERMEKNLLKTGGIISSQQVMLVLAEKGMAREKAHKLVQKIALKAWEEEIDFQSLLLNNPEISKLLSQEEIERCFDFKTLEKVDEIFSRFD